MTDRLLTPSKITAWLDCAHYPDLETPGGHRRPRCRSSRIRLAGQLLVEKGLQHEVDCLAEYRRRASTFSRSRPDETGEPFADWVIRVGNPFRAGYDVIYQMPFIHEGVRGIADFLVRVEDPEAGTCAYEPVDAKLARSEGKPGHVLQLCFYAEPSKP